MTGQGFAALGAAEDRFGHFAFHQQALRAIAHHDQLQIALWIRRLEGVEAAFEQAQVFLLRQTSYMDDGNIVLAQSPLLAQRIQAFGRVKQLAVDAARQQSQAFEMPAFQFHALADTRHQREVRTIVEPAQIVGQQPRQQTEAVLAGVLLEIGVKAADHRNAQTPRRTQCR
ncbi:hypothetical protein D3C85_1200000 [compost metagenome]